VPCLKDAGLANVLAVIQRLLFVPIQKTDAVLQTHETAFFGSAVVWVSFPGREFFVICTADSSTTGWQTEPLVTGHGNKRELPLIVSLQQPYSADIMPAGLLSVCCRQIYWEIQTAFYRLPSETQNVTEPVLNSEKELATFEVCRGVLLKLRVVWGVECRLSGSECAHSVTDRQSVCTIINCQAVSVHTQ
jgi:hypothetical protein